MRELFKIMTAMSLLLASTSGFADNTMTSDQNTQSQQSIVDIAKNNPNFSTFVTALQAADLANVLQAQGPFTVFAPTNDAFAKLPNGVLQDLLKPENKDKLRVILLYHVVPGKVLSSDVKTMKAKSVNGKDLNIVVNGRSVKVNNANVTKTDIVGSNGVIHVIDTVLLP